MCQISSPMRFFFRTIFGFQASSKWMFIPKACLLKHAPKRFCSMTKFGFHPFSKWMFISTHTRSSFEFLCLKPLRKDLASIISVNLIVFIFGGQNLIKCVQTLMPNLYMTTMFLEARPSQIGSMYSSNTYNGHNSTKVAFLALQLLLDLRYIYVYILYVLKI